MENNPQKDTSDKIFAKKSLGQNFLQSESALSAIVDAAKLQKDELVLEIGPGKGALTEKILESGSKLLAIEKDSELISFLEEKFSDEIAAGQFELINMDILEFDETILDKKSEKYKLIANIPYYITGGIIRKFLSSQNQPEQAVLLVQKEVAQRIISRADQNGTDKNPKNKESLLSLSVKIYSDPKFIKTVPAGSFVPAPNVDSAIISLENINKKALLDIAAAKKISTETVENEFFELLHLGFAHKRKTLMKNLKNKLDEEKILAVCEFLNQNNLNDKVRAEDLTLKDWLCLTEKII
jgi:16S rRNA (adenine1518-N6/adenine1519-N6)-dimethyltransferase